jgi:hypothetical protein
MREFADELSWWSDSPSTPVHLALSAYRDEVRRLREANLVTPKESDEQRLTRSLAATSAPQNPSVLRGLGPAEPLCPGAADQRQPVVS